MKQYTLCDVLQKTLCKLSVQKKHNDDAEIMGTGKDNTYDTAVSWLRKAHNIYLEHGRHAAMVRLSSQRA